MPEIPSVGHGSVGPVERAINASLAGNSAGSKVAPHETRLGDRVELSQHAQLLDRLRQLPDARTDLVEGVRKAIAGGTYETPEKLDVAIGRLIDDLTA